MTDLTTPFFYLFALTTIASSAAVVFHRRPTYCVLALSLAMLAQAGLLVLLKAYFVAVIQVLIYAGAILVLFLFVIMLLGIKGTEAAKKSSKKQTLLYALLSTVFLAELVFVFLAVKEGQPFKPGITGTVEAIGKVLFQDYLLPFELVSGILLIGIFGVVNLAQKEQK